MHAPGIIDISNPLSTSWHELYPQFCQNFTLTSWEDINLTGTLNGGDQIDMINVTGGEVHWYYVDRLTFTLYITPQIQGPQPMYIEFKGPYDSMILANPLGTLWHEVYPVYCPIYHIIGWNDTGQPYGQISFCDWIQLEDLSWWHVEQVSTDLILNEKIANPIYTYWNELYPTFGNRYHIIDWIDNGDGLLSPNDKVTFDTDQTAPYTVTDVTLTLNVTLIDNPTQRMYIEFTGGFPLMWEPKTNPVGTLWHEFYPVYSPLYEISKWDDNCNGVLSYCDNITLLDLNSGEVTLWHVE